MKLMLPRGLKKIKMKSIKHAPEILMTIGTVSTLAGFVGGIYSTTKAHEVFDTKDELMEEVKRAQIEFPEKYTEDEHKQDLFKIYARTVLDLTKLYIIPTTLTVVGIGCMIKGNRILSSRYKAAVGAYTSVLGAFNLYRSRVRDEFGIDKEKELYFGSNKVKAKIVNEDGKKESVEANVINGYSPYAFFFDESCNQWEKNPYYNKTFLMGIQENMNIKLQQQGFVTLADVKNELSTDGILVRPEDLCIGWVLGNGDDNVDFGIFEATNEAHRDFVNGITNTILLDPNCDGWILDKI